MIDAFVDAHSLAALLTARIIQGLATGGAIGAVGAGMLDIDPTRGAVANATAPGLGTAIGVLLSAFAVQWLPAPTQLIYVAFAGLLVIQMTANAMSWPAIPESSNGRRPMWSESRPAVSNAARNAIA